MDLEYELAAIKLFESDCVDDDDDTRTESVAVGDKSNAKTEILDSMKNAFQHFFSENRPVPIRFFKEKHREAFMEALRAHRVSLIQADKKKSVVAKNLPHVAEYYVEHYGTLNSVVYKMGKIQEFVATIAQNEDDDLDLYRYINEKAFDDFDQLKIELGDAQRSMMSDVDQLVETHRSAAQISDQIAKETQKRYESEEKYSDDGSTIIVSDAEKLYMRQLNSKVDEFLTQKSVFLENLKKLMTLAANVYGEKNKIYAKLKKHALASTSAESTSSEHAKPKIKITIGKTTEHGAVGSPTIFKKFDGN